MNTGRDPLPKGVLRDRLRLRMTVFGVIPQNKIAIVLKTHLTLFLSLRRGYLHDNHFIKVYFPLGLRTIFFIGDYLQTFIV